MTSLRNVEKMREKLLASKIEVVKNSSGSSLDKWVGKVGYSEVDCSITNADEDYS